MSNQSNGNFAFRLPLALAFAMAGWLSSQALAAEPTEEQNQMMQGCREMKELKQKMLDTMKAQNKELTELVTEMNRAPEDKKVGLMAAIITRMVEHRVATQTQMSEEQEKMAALMTQHMGQCPMMSGMKDDDDKPTVAQLTAADTERAFLQAMVPHHEMAVDMAKLAGQKAKNPALKTMAAEIIKSQSAEIKTMKASYQRLFGSEFAADKTAYERLGLTKEKAGMDMDMDMLGKTEGFDKMYSYHMAMHHQGAINMARKLLDAGTDAETRKLAANIIETQTKEIKILEGVK